MFLYQFVAIAKVLQIRIVCQGLMHLEYLVGTVASIIQSTVLKNKTWCYDNIKCKGKTRRYLHCTNHERITDRTVDWLRK